MSQVIHNKKRLLAQLKCPLYFIPYATATLWQTAVGY